MDANKWTQKVQEAVNAAQVSGEGGAGEADPQWTRRAAALPASPAAPPPPMSV